MNIVYNSNHYHVVEYQGLNSFEVIDKHLGVGGYLEGDVAQAFRTSLARIIEDDPTEDSVDEFLEGLNALMNQPVRFH